MSDPWFSEVGKRGSIILRYRESGWTATSNNTVKTVRCILQNDPNLSPEDGPYQVSGTVSKYIIGVGDCSDYLHFRANGEVSRLPDQTSSGVNKLNTKSEAKIDLNEESSSPYRELTEIDGTGDYISVIARVTEIGWVNKGESGTPDLQGNMTDKSVSDGVIFMITEDVPHPCFDENVWFLFDNVVDYHWESKNQNIILISDYTEFTELRVISPSLATNNTSASHSSSSRDRGSLDSIAKSKIGDMTFTISQEDRDSLVNKAKRKARNEQRDPAIDPHFQK